MLVLAACSTGSRTAGKKIDPASAMQAPPNPFNMWTKEFMTPLEPLSEDCLFLNIWTPAKSTGEKLPVMVWIHGGAFAGGYGTVPLYDGEEICKKGIVYVIILGELCKERRS